LEHAFVHHCTTPRVPLETFLYTFPLPPVDLLVRTSGEHRLSDFLLYQCHEHCQLVFLKPAWPEFSFWDVWWVLVGYQVEKSQSSFSVTSSTSDFQIPPNLLLDSTRFDPRIVEKRDSHRLL
ncbi:cis-prenyltransferase, partial [Coelomomyces lativittatus]